MRKYLIRLDDASEYMDIERWARMEKLLNRFSIRPIVGVIPENRDPSMVGIYKKNMNFWSKLKEWEDDGWKIAMHGCFHQYVTTEGGFNLKGKKSEFAGLSYNEQKDKVEYGYSIFESHNIGTNMFFAPSHTFDEVTLQVIKESTPIRIISDTIAYDSYKYADFSFVPQQSGRVRNIYLPLVTFCYHPNTCDDKMFTELEAFLSCNYKYFVPFSNELLKDRGRNILDDLLRDIYYLRK